jgi:hypothetical protein
VVVGFNWREQSAAGPPCRDGRYGFRFAGRQSSVVMAESRLILRWSLHVIDDEEFARPFAGVEPKP